MSKEKLYPALFTVTEVITADKAKEYLAKNIGNRTLSKARVENLASAILEDRFEHTHQGIAFDVYGDLVDGQHRLEAIVLAGKAVTMQVTRGVKPESKIVIDSEMRTRSVADALRISGSYTATKQTVAVAKLWFGLCGRQQPNIFEVQQFLQDHEESITFAIDLALQHSITRHAAILTMLAIGYEQGHEQEMRDWCEVVKTGETDGQAFKTSALRFRDYWLVNRHGGGFQVRKDFCHRIYASMVAWIERRGLSKLYAKDRIDWLEKYKS